MRNKDVWWSSGWFWGWVVPFLVPVAFLIAASLKLSPEPATIMLCLAAVPLVGLLGFALLVISRDGLQDLDRWLHRKG
jgi:hypothetical protein